MGSRPLLQLWSERKALLSVILASLALALILLFPVIASEAPNRCFAIVIFAVILWIANGVPLFVTGLMIPILGVLLRVMRDKEGNVVPATVAANRLIVSMFSGTIITILASFAIALSFSKHPIPFLHKNSLLDRLSRRIALLILICMYLTVAFSIMMPNISVVMLICSLLSSKLRATDADPRLTKGLLLGLAMAGNIAGFISPVSSAQSIVAYDVSLGRINVGWANWLRASVPVATLAIIGCWLIIVTVLGLHRNAENPSSLRSSHSLEAGKTEEDDLKKYPSNFTIVSLLAITAITLALWSCTNYLLPIVGNMGIISLFPLVAYFGMGILTVRDLSLLSWDIILLAMGALSLTEAAQGSGLLEQMGLYMTSSLDGKPFWLQTSLIALVILITATFKSRLVSALIFLPVTLTFVETNSLLVDNRGITMFLMATFATCTAMALPFSSPINMSMFSITNSEGARILSFGDFVKVGLPGCIWCYLVLISVGYVALRLT